MYAPTAKGASAARPARTSAKISTTRPKVATASDSHRPAARAVLAGDRHRGQVEHQVGHDRADGAARELGRQVDRDLPVGHPAEEPVGQGDDRVEVAARHRPEGEDQGDQAGTGGERVLQQLQADVVRREPLGRDAGADDDGDQAGRPEELRQRLPGEEAQPQRGGHAGVSGGGVEQVGDGGERGRADRVVDPHAALLAVEQPGRVQHLEVVADRGLGQVEGVVEVADAGLAGGTGGDQADQPQPHRVGQRLQQGRDLLGLGGGHGRAGRQRGAAGEVGVADHRDLGRGHRRPS